MRLPTGLSISPALAPVVVGFLPTTVLVGTLVRSFSGTGWTHQQHAARAAVSGAPARSYRTVPSADD